MTKGPEKQFEDKVKAYLESIGVYPAGFPSTDMRVPEIGWYVKVWGGGFQKAGIPDILACILGRFFSIELKSQTGRPTELQMKNTNMIRDSGGAGIILWPSGFEKFQNDLTAYICYERQMYKIYK